MIRTGNVAALGGVGFSDAATAVTAGAAGVVLRSSQDGTFWTSVGPERTTRFTTVDVLGQNGWITDRDGRLYLTTDGGQSWTLIPRTDPLDLGSLQAVACTDDQNAWAIGAGVIPSIVHTADGGLTWTRQFSGHLYNGTLQDAPLGLAFPTSTSGWVVGDQGLILHTSDAGATWTRQSFGSNRLIGVAFADDRNGWAVGWDSTILHTVDGGATWTRQTVPAGIGDSERFLGVSCTDASTAWVVGYYGEILHTSDGGTNWRLEDSGVSWDLKGVTFTDPLTGWAVADWSLLHTVDGGVTWTPVTVDPLVWLTGVSFADARTGWAVGAQGAMLRTTDGGKTWTHEESGLTSDQAVACVAAADTYTAWAVAGSVVLHRGREWQTRRRDGPDHRRRRVRLGVEQDSGLHRPDVVRRERRGVHRVAGRRRPPLVDRHPRRDRRTGDEHTPVPFDRQPRQPGSGTGNDRPRRRRGPHDPRADERLSPQGEDGHPQVPPHRPAGSVLHTPT